MITIRGLTPGKWRGYPYRDKDKGAFIADDQLQIG